MKPLNLFFIIILTSFMFSCAAPEESATSADAAAASGTNGGDNPASSNHVRTTLVSSGSSQCTYGGVQIEMGIDENMNGMLDESEVDKTDYVCNGSPGSSSDNGTTGSSGQTSLLSIADESEGDLPPLSGPC